MKKYNDMAFKSCNDVKMLALCIYGEARGEGIEGMLAVGSVVCNRARQKQKTIKDICLEPKQFSCFNAGDPNREVLEGLCLNWADYIHTNKELRASFWVAYGLTEKYLSSNVGDANHYHADTVSPAWSKAMVKVKQIKRHVFWWDANYAKK